MERILKLTMMVMLALAGFTSFADDVLYFMVDNPTIQDWLGQQYQASEAGSHGRTITDARIAAVTDVSGYEALGNDPDLRGDTDVAIIYLDLYYNDGAKWVVDPTADPRLDSAGIESGILSDGKTAAAYGMASIGTINGDASAYSFAIELGTWDGDTWVVAAVSEISNYAALESFRREELGIQTQLIWTPDTYAAPEPSGGLLVLVGCAILALRRKKEIQVEG